MPPRLHRVQGMPQAQPGTQVQIYYQTLETPMDNGQSQGPNISFVIPGQQAASQASLIVYNSSRKKHGIVGGPYNPIRASCTCSWDREIAQTPAKGLPAIWLPFLQLPDTFRKNYSSLMNNFLKET